MSVEGGRKSIVRKLLEENIRNWEVKEFLEYELARYGFVKADIVRTPFGTRITVWAERPSAIMSRRSRLYRELVQKLQRKFGLENVRINARPVLNPDLNAKIVACRIARAMAKGIKFRRAARIALARVLAAGARGVEIKIDGKLTSERSRFEKYTIGKMIKNGQDAIDKVDKATVYVLLKPGIYGIKVRIVPPNVKLVDDVTIKKPEEVQKLLAEVKEAEKK